MSITITTAADAVLALHRPDSGHNPNCHCGIESGSGADCRECRKSYPCPTVTAVLNALNEVD